MNSLIKLMTILTVLATVDANSLSPTLASIINCSAIFPPYVLKSSDITIYLYTPNNINTPNILNVNSSLDNTYFNVSNRCTFVTHGWLNSYTSPVCVDLRDAFLSNFTDNVFVVDWSGPASNINYLVANSAVYPIGIAVGQFIIKMMNNYSIPAANITMLGHSLGAHLCGVAGSLILQAVEGIKWIIGLDPAGPCYTPDTSNRIDPSDAKFVQIIHTNADEAGIAFNCGDSDYWPNEGTHQPGCDPLNVTCSHWRSFQYCAESIQYNGFTAKNYITKTPSFLGHYNIDITANGSYFLNTASTYPYSLG